jgi:spore coat protein U-like protein
VVSEEQPAAAGRPRLGPTVAALAAILLGASSLPAQTVASISATVDVLTLAPLTASGVNDLNFGTVTPGTSASPADLAADAGRFDLTGEPNAVVTISFTLPIQLTSPSGSIPVSFGATDGLRWTLFPTFYATFDPTAPLIATLNASGTLTIGITGTVSPPPGALPDTYTSTITLTVSYL